MKDTLLDEQRLWAADNEPDQWFTSGRDFKLQHYSPLEQINSSNVDQLGLAWEYPVTYRGRVQHGLEATPHVIDGVMYTSGPWGSVYALDAATGEQRWRYDPPVDGNWARRMCCGVVNRGIAIWQNTLYVGTLDGYLVALDASNGEARWKVDTFTDRKRHYSITSAPWIAGDKIVIGNSGGEKGVRGYISAYHITSGELAWRFYTVPGDPNNEPEHPEMVDAAKTWSPDTNWESGGGGTVWGHMAYDPQLNLLYIGTGNGGPYPSWHRSPGGGDNLFLATILAINPDTGKLVWHYQTTPGEKWDYTATQHMILAELEIEDRVRKVVMQAPKNGFFYVLDRETGELLSAEPYVRVNWASHIDMSTGRPVLTGEGNYQEKPTLVLPGPWGGHNWQPMSYNPKIGLVYIPAIDSASLFKNVPNYRFDPKGFNIGALYYWPPFPVEEEKHTHGYNEKGIQEFLLAWNPITQKPVWKLPIAGAWNGGTLTTASGLVIQGTSTGQLVIYNGESGATLKTINIGTGIMAAPMSFAINGIQYIAVMAGYGGAMSSAFPPEAAANYYDNRGRILAFKLGGSDVPLPDKLQDYSVPNPPSFNQTELNAKYDHGKQLFQQYCVACHRGTGTVKSAYPSLFSLPENVHAIFNRIVLDGLLSHGGMARFDDTLTQQDAAAIQAYLILEQKKLVLGEDIESLSAPH